MPDAAWRLSHIRLLTRAALMVHSVPDDRRIVYLFNHHKKSPEG